MTVSRSPSPLQTVSVAKFLYYRCSRALKSIVTDLKGGLSKKNFVKFIFYCMYICDGLID